MFSSQDMAQSIEDMDNNSSHMRLKKRLPRMSRQDIDDSFVYAINHQRTEMLNVLVHNATLSQEQHQRALLHFVTFVDTEKTKNILAAYPQTDTTTAMRMAIKNSSFAMIKILVPYTTTHNIDRAFEDAMENGDWGIVKFLVPHISQDGDHVNALIYASDANREDLFELLYTIPRAQQAFENVKLLDQGVWGEGLNIKTIKDRLEMDLQKQRIQSQIAPNLHPTTSRKM